MKLRLLVGCLLVVLAAPIGAQELPDEMKVTVPVLSAPKNVNEPITADDLTTVELPAKKLSGDVLTDMKTIIGQAPRRPLRANVPIRTIDLRKTYIVMKGAKVTMLYQNGPLQLTANGRALDNGGVDDTVRVVNSTSNQTVEGRVSGTNTVRLDNKP